MLEVRDIHKEFEGRPLLKGVSFSVQHGETVCLLGASGSGKSTILRIIAGLEASETGYVLWNGQDMSQIPVHKRNFSLMFQDYALFPHRNVSQNIAFGLRMHGVKDAEIKKIVPRMLDQVNLRGFGERRVTELSGGEQQRVALARALAHHPHLLMLDEPLGALDRALRAQLTEELRLLLHQEGIPAIYVTHDQEEAFAIADRIILLHDGQVVQSGSPFDVYSQPKSTWVARFLGLNNLLEGEIISTNPVMVNSAIGRWLPGQCHLENLQLGQKVTLLLRPVSAQRYLYKEHDEDEMNILRGVITDSVFRGDDFRIDIHCDCGEAFQITSPSSMPVGEKIALKYPGEMVLCLIH